MKENKRGKERFYGSNKGRYASFILEGQDFVVDLLKVKEIVNVPEDIRALPGYAEYIRGIMDYRGKPLCIVDLKKRLGFDYTEIKKYYKVMIVDIDQGMFGLLVEEVPEVIYLSNDDFSDIPEGVTKVDKNLISKIINKEGALKLYLNVEEFINEGVLDNMRDKDNYKSLKEIVEDEMK